MPQLKTLMTSTVLYQCLLSAGRSHGQGAWRREDWGALQHARTDCEKMAAQTGSQ